MRPCTETASYAPPKPGDPDLCHLKKLFFRHFLRENALSRPNRPFFTHSVIHIQKAVHLRIQKIRLKFHFRHPVKRQIFGDGDGLDPALILALCHKAVLIPQEYGDNFFG